MTEHSLQPPEQTITTPLQAIFNSAQKEAILLKAPAIGPEHLLLGMINPDHHFNLAEHFLATTLPEQYPDLYRELHSRMAEASTPAHKVPTVQQLRPDALAVLAKMFEEAQQLQQDFVTSLHLLYGISKVPGNPATRLLQQHGINSEQIHMTLEMMTQPLEPLAAENRLQISPDPTQSGSHAAPGREGVEGSQAHTSRFDKFSVKARTALAQAQEEAIRFKHNYIGTEHLLLGIVHEPGNVACNVLLALGIEPPKVREAINFILGQGEHTPTGAIGLTPRAKKVIELGVDEARRSGHRYIGTEHMLLGIVREGEGIAAGVLNSLGVDEAKVRATTFEVLRISSEAEEIDESPQFQRPEDSQN